MKKLTLIIGIAAFLLLAFLVSIPIVNDRAAKRTAESIKDIELPEHTEYVETFSEAGKLVGNGNGMQYLGGILIKSDLLLADLQAYYGQKDGSCIVEAQSGKKIRFIEHGEVTLSADIAGDTYFIVYAWGSNDSFFGELDIRGH